MRNRPSGLVHGEPDADLLNRLFFVQQVCLVLVVQMGLITLGARVSPALQSVLPQELTAMPLFSAIAALLCSLSLFLSEQGKSARTVAVGNGIAICAACAALGTLCERLAAAPGGLAFLLPSGAGRIALGSPSLVSPAAFFLLGSLIFLLRATDRNVSYIADAQACALGLLIMILVMEFLFSEFQVEGSTLTGLTSPQTLTCLLLLTVVALLRRAEYGLFSFFLGHGMGNRVGRALLPALLVLPFLFELGRAQLVDAQILSSHYISAIFAAFATLVAVALLLLVATHINQMQAEIHDLGLRDELTSLYNVRGFYLLAEQAMLLAKRAHQDFGVLFIDVDNLKQINDSNGHSAGSTLLVETARLLRSTFRDTDVIGRVGGDEFVVAGQFDPAIMNSAIERLRACAASNCADPNRPSALSLSMGYAPILRPQETLKELVMRADQAMYDEKRQKKLFATA